MAYLFSCHDGFVARRFLRRWQRHCEIEQTAIDFIIGNLGRVIAQVARRRPNESAIVRGFELVLKLAHIFIHLMTPSS